MRFARHTQCFWHPPKCREFFGRSFLLPCAALLALFLKLCCFLFLLILLARPVPIINLPGPVLTIYVGPFWAPSWAVGGHFLLACAMFLALRPKSNVLTSLKGIFCHLFAEVYFCRPAQCFWPFSPNSRRNSRRNPPHDGPLGGHLGAFWGLSWHHFGSSGLHLHWYL